MLELYYIILLFYINKFTILTHKQMFDRISLVIDGDYMKIKKIKKLSNGKYNLLMDDNSKIIAYDEVIINNNLLYNNEIDSDLLNKINNENSFYKIYNKVIKLISVRLRSEHEIIDYLNNNNINENDQKKIIDLLKLNNLINDDLFVKSYIYDKINLSNYGPNKIKRDLLNYNIDDSIINSEIENIDKNLIINKIDKLVNKKINSNNKYSNYILKQKLIIYLIDLGFDKDDIVLVLNNYDFYDDDLIYKNYDKLYKKLSQKYSDKILYQKIKEKLYRMGFSLSQIDKVINEKMDF